MLLGWLGFSLGLTLAAPPPAPTPSPTPRLAQTLVRQTPAWRISHPCPPALPNPPSIAFSRHVVPIKTGSVCPPEWQLLLLVAYFHQVVGAASESEVVVSGGK